MSVRRRSTRADDLRLLGWLRDRSNGISAAEISRAAGLSSAKIRVATNRVLEADRDESGEPVSQVIAGYWRGGK